MDRKIVEAEILVLALIMLTGKATEEEIERVAKLALDNDCQDILAREFKGVSSTLCSL